MWSEFKNNLYITKRQWNGLIVLFGIVAAYMLVIYIQQPPNVVKALNNKSLQAVRMLRTKAQSGRGLRFAFNPNTVTAQQLAQLGFTPGQVNNIVRYRQKGGRYVVKADLLKMYTIDTATFNQLQAYITLPEAIYVEPVNINTANATQLKALKGIGPAFAARIIKYRQLLGGYHHINQLREVYGLSADTYKGIEQAVTVGTPHLQYIYINTATAHQLNRLPYLSYKQANAIEQYRIQHGNYLRLADLEDIAILDAATLQKIKPYISFK